MRPLNITLNCNIGALTIPGIAFLIALFFGVYEAADMRKRAEEPPALRTERATQGQATEANNAGQQRERETKATGSK